MNLPPLPEPDIQYVSGHRDPISIYYEDDILDYGIACAKAAIDTTIDRLFEMHKIASNEDIRNLPSWHNHYWHAALELSKLKETI